MRHACEAGRRHGRQGARAAFLVCALAVVVGCRDETVTVGGLNIYLGAPGGAQTHVVVSVQRGVVQGDVVGLRSRVEGSAGTAERVLTEPGGGAIVFPATYVIAGDRLSGEIGLRVEALDAAGDVIGRGTGRAEVIPSAGVATEVVLGLPCLETEECNDHDFCTGLELCLDGVCRPGQKAPQCDDEKKNPNDGCEGCRQTRWNAEVVFGFGRSEGRADRITLPVPYGVAVDRLGNLFVGDWQDNRVWRLDAQTARVTAYAGTGQSGYSGDNGPATAAQLSSVNGIALDERRNLYVAEWGNHVIRKVTPQGVVSTVAGTGRPGFSGDDGPAQLAQLNTPNGVRVDGQGNIYIADYANHRVRMVSAVGTITTLAGTGMAGFSGDDGPAASAQLNSPVDVAVDRAGNVYVADSLNHRVRRIDVTGRITTFAGNGTPGDPVDDAVAAQAPLTEPWGLALDPRDDSLVIACRDHTVRRVADGRITRVAGQHNVPGYSLDGLTAVDSQLNYPAYVAVDRSGNIIVSEEYNQVVRRIGTDGILVTVLGLSGAVYPGYGTTPTGDICDPVDTTDAGVAPPDCTQGAFTGWLQGPNAVAIDSAGNLYIPEYEGHRIRRVSADGSTVETYVGTGELGCTPEGALAEETSINIPDAVLIDLNGDLVFTDSGNHRVLKVDRQTRRVSRVAGTAPAVGGECAGIAGYQGDGQSALSAQLNLPAGLAIDGRGNLFISDAQNFVVRRVDPAGVITTVAGTGAQEYFVADGGRAIESGIGHAYAIGAAQDGTLYIADDTAHVISAVDVDGGIRVVAGNGEPESDGDNGPATEASIFGPGGVTVAPGGVLFVSEAYGNRVRRIAADGTITTAAGTGRAGISGDRGAATQARLNKPYYLAVDGAGRLYIADYGNGLVRRVNGDNTITSVAGMVHPGDGPFRTAALFSPAAMVALGDTRLLIADGTGGRVRLADLGSGTLLTVAGYPSATDLPPLASAAGPPSVGSRFLRNAAGLAYDPTGPAVFVSEREGHVIRRIALVDPADPNTWTIQDWVGSPGIPGRVGAMGATRAAARLNGPAGLLLDSANRQLLVTEVYNHDVLRILLDAPDDPASVRAFVNVDAVQGYSGDGDAAGERPAAEASLDSPSALALGAGGEDLYIADTGNHRVRYVHRGDLANDTDDTISSILGDGFPASSGAGAPARFFPVDTPRGVAVDAHGNVWVTSSQTVRVISPTAGKQRVTGDDGEYVQTAYGTLPRDTFPQSVTQCVSSVLLPPDGPGATSSQAGALVVDACQGFLLRLSRVVVTP